MLSVPTRRRLDKFKANRRGLISFKIFALIFLISLFSDFIANDKPIFVSFAGESYFPIFKAYPETAFGGDFATEADYLDPYLHSLIRAQGFMVMPLIKYDYKAINYNLKAPPPTSPDRYNLLGTDDQGRDILARILYGLRFSILFAFALTITSSIIGILLGAIQGYFAGRVDLIMQRFIEVWAGLPVLFLLIILSGFVTPNFWWLLCIMLLFSWMSLAGPVRAEFLKARNLTFVKAARAMGVKERNIILRHILPNALVASLTFIPFILSGAIVALTSLDFLGFGLPPGSPSLGELLAQGKNNPSSPWIGLTVFFMLSLVLTLLVFIGEAVRDSFR
jgi:microcin C transport system permease protein